MLSEKSEDRRSVAGATVRRSEGFAANRAQNGVGKKIMNRLLDRVVTHFKKTGFKTYPH